MASKTGSDTIAVFKVGTTFGTAEEGGAGDKLQGQINRAKNVTPLIDDTIGSGDDLLSEAAPGATSPTITTNKTARFDDAGVAAEAVFFGNTSFTDMGSGAYTHSMLYNASRNEHFGTIAMHGHTTGIYEYPSCTPTGLTVNLNNPPNYVKHDMEFLADEEVISGTTNTTTTIESATLSNTKTIVVEPSDWLLVNAQAGGALDTGTDSKPFTSATITYAVPASHVAEVKGSAGNSEPVVSGDPPFDVTISVTFKEQADFTWVTAQGAETEYKAEFRITGSLIGGAVYYGCSRFFPRLKIIDAPDYNLTSSSINPLTVTFKALTASSAPTGMITTLPYVLYTNEQSSAYLT